MTDVMTGVHVSLVARYGGDSAPHTHSHLRHLQMVGNVGSWTRCQQFHQRGCIDLAITFMVSLGES